MNSLSNLISKIEEFHKEIGALDNKIIWVYLAELVDKPFTIPNDVITFYIKYIKNICPSCGSYNTMELIYSYRQHVMLDLWDSDIIETENTKICTKCMNLTTNEYDDNINNLSKKNLIIINILNAYEQSYLKPSGFYQNDYNKLDYNKPIIKNNINKTIINYLKANKTNIFDQDVITVMEKYIQLVIKNKGTL